MQWTNRLTATTPDIPGHTIVESKGVVRGLVVRSRSLLGNIGARLQTLSGSKISLYTELCERSRADAFNEMVEHAGQIGAHGVVGVRYSSAEVAPGVTEVICYGTAVVLKANPPLNQPAETEMEPSPLEPGT
jgi:uncharacterized protein YbjQ (UPF0145 family)